MATRDGIQELGEYSPTRIRELRSDLLEVEGESDLETDELEFSILTHSGVVSG
jgi:hypothetical protein